MQFPRERLYVHVGGKQFELDLRRVSEPSLYSLLIDNRSYDLLAEAHGDSYDVMIGAVVVKSANESQAAKDQLQRAEYMVLDEAWRPVPWGPQAPSSATIACRSGLTPQELWSPRRSTRQHAIGSRAGARSASLKPCAPDCPGARATRGTSG